MPEEVVGSQFDGFLRRDECQVHCRTWEEKKKDKEEEKKRKKTDRQTLKFNSL